MGRSRRTPSRTWIWLIAGLVLLGSWQVLQRDEGRLQPAFDSGRAAAAKAHADPALRFLPAEAHATIALIDRGGPYPYRQDGTVFQNRQRLLPQRPRGHYREFTVDTPGLAHRGARRIVTGGDPPGEWYYTDDHYNSFRRFERGEGP